MRSIGLDFHNPRGAFDGSMQTRNVQINEGKGLHRKGKNGEMELGSASECRSWKRCEHFAVTLQRNHLPITHRIADHFAVY